MKLHIAIATLVLATSTALPALAAAAAGAHGGIPGSGHGIRGLRVEPPPRAPDMQSRIPAPLPAPAQPPTINGPLSPNPMLPLMGNGL